MTLQYISSMTRVRNLNLDTWSELYVGVRHICYELLPEHQYSCAPKEVALSAIAIVVSNQLMEIAIYNILSELSRQSELNICFTELEDMSYYKMICKILPMVAKQPRILTEEPFLSTERLRRRRNCTAHKVVLPVTLEMARSALFSSVQGVKELYQICDRPFPYDEVLKKYPYKTEEWFSSIDYPEEKYQR